MKLDAPFEKITRIVVVFPDGTVWQKQAGGFADGVEIHIQDDGRTLKVFPRKIEPDPAPRSEDVMPVAEHRNIAHGHEHPCPLFYVGNQNFASVTCTCGALDWRHCGSRHEHGTHRYLSDTRHEYQCGGVS